jgi:hypothetical protein
MYILFTHAIILYLSHQVNLRWFCFPLPPCWSLRNGLNVQLPFHRLSVSIPTDPMAYHSMMHLPVKQHISSQQQPTFKWVLLFHLNTNLEWLRLKTINKCHWNNSCPWADTQFQFCLLMNKAAIVLNITISAGYHCQWIQFNMPLNNVYFYMNHMWSVFLLVYAGENFNINFLGSQCQTK